MPQTPNKRQEKRNITASNAVKSHKFYQRFCLAIVLFSGMLLLLSEIVYVQMHQIRSHHMHCQTHACIQARFVTSFSVPFHSIRGIKRGALIPCCVSVPFIRSSSFFSAKVRTARSMHLCTRNSHLTNTIRCHSIR